MRSSSLRLQVLGQLYNGYPSFVVVTAKENKTVYGDMEILNGVSYAIRLLGYYILCLVWGAWFLGTLFSPLVWVPGVLVLGQGYLRIRNTGVVIGNKLGM